MMMTVANSAYEKKESQKKKIKMLNVSAHAKVILEWKESVEGKKELWTGYTRQKSSTVSCLCNAFNGVLISNWIYHDMRVNFYIFDYN